MSTKWIPVKNKTTEGKKIPQILRIWEHSDDTVVGYKPLGDDHRSYATYSLEVKKDPGLPDHIRELRGIAFKVDAKGRAWPASHTDLPPPRSRVFADWVMPVTHRGFVDRD